MNTRVEYGPRVSLVIDQEESGDYRRAAEHLNSRVDVVSLQHEFGLFGGKDGEFVLDLVERLDRPLITTFHTVLRDPSPNQLRIVEALCRASAMVLVMTAHTRRLLREKYDAAGCRIEVVPHGVPLIPDERRHRRGGALYPGRRVIVSAGLLSPSKGIELVIEALAKVLPSHPEALYVILGATHPEVRRRNGEQYREALMAQALSLGVADNVAFVDEFVAEETLVEYLLRADLFITPHHSREQSSSGTLTYAMAAGNAVISTRYPYAQEMLGGGVGILVDHDDVASMGRAISAVLSDDSLRDELRSKTYDSTRPMLWPVVGEKFARLAIEVAPGTGRPGALPLANIKRPSLDHLLRLTDGTGVAQHALGAVPDRNFGYCTDDNARALQFAVNYLQSRPNRRVRRLFEASFAFVLHAFNEQNGRFRNLMSYDRRWLDDRGSDDTQGRAIQALAHVATASLPGGYQVAALSRLSDVLQRGFVGTTSPRAVSFAALGLHAYLAAHPSDSGIAAQQYRFGDALRPLARIHEADWPWPESTLTYENGRLPEAMIAVGRDTGDASLVDAGVALAEWLFHVVMSADGSHVSLVGNRGWWHSGEPRAEFDQQPVEIVGLIGAALQAHAATGDPRWTRRADLAYRWFLGQNDLGVSLYEEATGGCYDGLEAQGVNRNQGAESILSLLVSWQSIASLSLPFVRPNPVAGAFPARVAALVTPAVSALHP